MVPLHLRWSPSMALQLLAVAGIVFGLNLLPAFGPPTSAVLVALSLNLDLPPAPLVAVGAVSAAAGRYTLARGTRKLRPRLSERRRASFDAAQRYLTEHRGGAVAGLALFALSPVPSGQLFVAAGLMEVPLAPLTAAFFAGRVVSYTIYVAGASALSASLGDAFAESLTSPLGIGLQLLALAALALFVKVDWAARLPGARSDAEHGADREHQPAADRDPREAGGGPAAPGLGEQLDEDQGQHRAGREPE